MSLPVNGTEVTYPAGATDGSGEVLAVVPMDGRWGVIVDRTPFHPVDHTWPDQPADAGVLVVEGREVPVVECVTGAAEGGVDELKVGADIPVSRGAEGWRWFVVHVVEQETKTGPIELRVDQRLRHELSTGHTGCHLMALALNEALEERWRKPARTDGLGRPDFDALAIVSSTIHPNGSTDIYRIGKSLRKKGFVLDGLDVLAVQERVNATLAKWIATDARVRVEVPSPELTARRTWSCELPEGTPTIPCGGTHLTRLGQLGQLEANLTLNDDGLVVQTRARATPAAG